MPPSCSISLGLIPRPPQLPWGSSLLFKRASKAAETYSKCELASKLKQEHLRGNNRTCGPCHHRHQHHKQLHKHQGGFCPSDCDEVGNNRTREHNNWLDLLCRLVCLLLAPDR